MSTTPSPTFGAIRAPLVDKEGKPSLPFLKKLQEWESKLNGTITTLGVIQGQIAANAKIQGRTEGIGTTVSNILVTGQFNSTDNIVDGTGSPLNGGKRGFVALDTNNRLANSFRGTGVNVSSTPTSNIVLANNGVASTITVAASTNQFAPSGVAYNSGSVDPGVFGSFVVFADDPTFAGGSVIYQASANPPDQTAAEGRSSFGKIISLGGSAKTGGGNTGGTTPGGIGGRGYIEL